MSSASSAKAPTMAGQDEMDRDLQAARRILTLEAEGLITLSESLDARLSGLLDILARVTGRVVVTGMGKSGHIARKIAATLASTGTPALFVHPGEASHGDLGMVTAADAVIALSNSGKTAELTDLIVYTRRFGIPLIAILRVKALSWANRPTPPSSCRRSRKPVRSASRQPPRPP